MRRIARVESRERMVVVVNRDGSEGSVLLAIVSRNGAVRDRSEQL